MFQESYDDVVCDAVAYRTPKVNKGIYNNRYNLREKEIVTFLRNVSVYAFRWDKKVYKTGAHSAFGTKEHFTQLQYKVVSSIFKSFLATDLIFQPYFTCHFSIIFDL